MCKAVELLNFVVQIKPAVFGNLISPCKTTEVTGSTLQQWNYDLRPGTKNKPC